MPSEQEEFEFRARAEQEAESRRRTPQEMSKEYTGTLLPFRIDAEGKRHLAVPGAIQSAYQAITAPGRAIQSTQGDYVEPDKGGFNPQEEAGNVALNVIPGMARGMKLPSMTARATERFAGEASKASVRDATWAEAKAEGFKLPPGVVEPSLVGHASDTLIGSSYLKKGAQIANQQTVDRLARKAAGLGENDPLDIPHFKAAREAMAAPYKEIEAISPKAKQALKQVQSARAKSRELHKDANRTGRSEKREEARKWDKTADRWEGVIDQEATKLGRPGLLRELQEARVKIAKSHDVQEATNMGSGEVDARYIGRKFDAAPERMTGELATIGKFANAFKDYVREGAVDTGSNVHIGAHASPHSTPGMFAWLGSGIPFARGPLRSMALSDFAQQTRSYKPGLGVKLGDIASRAGPYGFSVVPQLGLRVPESEREE